MVRKLVALITLVLTVSWSTLAQNTITANRFEIEVDPIAYVLSGYSLHLGHIIGHFRLDVGVFGIKQPDFALSSDKFSVFTSGAGVKLDYIFKGDKGLFGGVQSDFSTDRITLKTGSATEKVSGPTLGLRMGYRFLFGKKEPNRQGFYLVPWIALINQPSPKMIQLDGQTYQQTPWSVFPTVHVGYRF